MAAATSPKETSRMGVSSIQMARMATSEVMISKMDMAFRKE